MRVDVIAAISLGVVLGCNIALRSFPVFFPQLQSQARVNVESRMYEKVAADVRDKNPDLPPEETERLIRAELLSEKKRSGSVMLKDIAKEHAKLKDNYQDPSGRTYLMELDCWHWARYVENVYNHGFPGDTVKNGKQWDTYMLAPKGTEVPWNTFLFYASAYAYKLVRVFSGIPLYGFLFYVPVVLTTVMLALLFWFCHRYYGLVTAVTSTMFVGLGPMFFPRSCAGWFDTDVLNLLLPLAVSICYLETYGRQALWHKLLLLAGAGLFIGLFAWTWAFWWFIVLIIALYEAYSLLDLLSEHLQYKTPVSGAVKRHISTFLVFFVFSIAWVYIFAGKAPFASFVEQLKDSMALNSSLKASLWPNVYSTVAELARPDMGTIIGATGGFVLFLSSLFSMVLLILLHKRFSESRREMVFFMIVWFLVMFWATNKGVRLIVFLLIPMGVLLGAGLETLFGWARERGRLWSWSVFAGLSVLLGALMFNNGRQAAEGSFPLIDDQWYSVLSTIKEKTPRNAVINSWWDFGDWFKTVGDRKVIFDGQSQNTPQGYWMARVLLANDEKKAVAILRMLNNGGNRAFDLIDGHLHNQLRSMMLLEKVLGARRYDAERTLMAVLPRSVTGRVLHILYGTPPPAYFIVDYTMPSKMPPISFIGNWDFLKVYLSKNCRSRTQPEVVAELNSAGIPAERAESLYQSARYLPEKGLDDWISDRLHYYVSSDSKDEQGSFVYFDSGVVWNTGDDSARVYDSYHGKFARPEALFIARNGTIEEKRFEKNDGRGSLLLYKEGDKYRSIQMDTPLGRCLFTRLYYLRGAGLSHFSLFSQSDEDGRVIRVYEIDWKGK